MWCYDTAMTLYYYISKWLDFDDFQTGSMHRGVKELKVPRIADRTAKWCGQCGQSVNF